MILMHTPLSVSQRSAVAPMSHHEQIRHWEPQFINEEVSAGANGSTHNNVADVMNVG